MAEFTPEQISYAEHTLKTEIKKIKKRMNEIKAEMEELKPKGLFGIFKNNKDEIEMLKVELSLEEDRLIELEGMTAIDYLIHTQKQRGNDNDELDEILDDPELVEAAADMFIPGAGGAVSKIAAPLLKVAIKKTLKK